MKKLSFILFTLVIINSVFCQTIVKEKLFCKTLNDTIHLNIYLPKDWNKNNEYQTIYCFDNEEDKMVALNVELQSEFDFYTGWIPKTIVVGIVDGRNKIKFDFMTGQLEKKGDDFLDFLSNTIIPDISTNYHTSRFRVIYGHSYIATYANYLFLYHPGLFNGYMLLSPERWWVDESKPKFNLDSNLVKYYNTHPTFYYIASGSKDISRRLDYAKEIVDKVRILDSTNFIFKYQNFPNATHNSLVYSAIPSALIQTFKVYYNFHTIDSVGNPWAYFKKSQNEFSSLYELPLGKSTLDDNSTVNKCMELAQKDKDTVSATKFEKYFLDDSASGIDCNDFGGLFINLGLKNRAKECYEKGIERAEKSELNSIQGYINIQWAYAGIVFQVFGKDSLNAWNAIQKALNDTNIKKPAAIVVYFYVGDLSIQFQYHLKEGLKQLLIYEKEYKSDPEVARWGRNEAGVTEDVLYAKIGKCYLLLNDKKNAKLYATKSLSINSDNEEAKNIDKKLH